MQPVYAYDPYNMGSNVPIPAAVGYAGQPVVTPVVPGAVPGVVPGAVPGAITFGKIQCVLVADPMAELNSCTSVIIKQQPELLEAMTGCETANRYHVLGNVGGYFKYLFKCVERSSFCMRNCCPSNLREFDMGIFHAVSSPITGNMTGGFARAYKPCKVPCFCFNRPEIIVNLGADNKYIGKIKNMFTCCDPEFEVYNPSGLKYFVRANCCQCGLLCANNFCGKMSSAVFEILQPGSTNVIANITKMSAQSFSEMVTDADSYQISFPAGATAEDKLLLIALGLMIDYQYFETDSSDENTGYRRRHGYGYGGYGY